MMTCQDMIDFLMDYVDDDLTPEQRARFDEHLAICPECEDYLKSYQSTVALSQLMCDDLDTAPEPMPEELVSAIMEAHRAAG